MSIEAKHAKLIFGLFAILVMATSLLARSDRIIQPSQTRLGMTRTASDGPTNFIEATTSKFDVISEAEFSSKLERISEEVIHSPITDTQPDEAAEFYRLKRVPEGETSVPVERYLTAREHMRSMRQYSTAQGRFLTAQHELQNQSEASALGTWASLGPGNIGGRTRALLIHPVTPNVMYAAGVAGGVWKTMNGGASWMPLADLMSNLAVNSLAMDPTNSNVIYAGTGEGYFNGDAVRGLGIFKTTDGGDNWTPLASTSTSNFYYVNDIVISPNNNQHLYAATNTGVWRSLDGGANWVRVLDPQVNGGCLDLAMRTDQKSDYIFASCGGAGSSNGGIIASTATIYRNTDAGGVGDWTAVCTEPGMGRTSLAIAPSNQNVIYAAAASTAIGTFRNGLQAVFRSTTGGDPGTWAAQVRNTDTIKLNTTLFSNTILAFFRECGFGTSNSFINQGWYDNVIAVDPQEANRVWIGGVDLFRSDDGGANWGQASHWWTDKTAPQYAHSAQHAIVFHPQYNGTTNQVMFVSNDGGLFRTENARAAVATGPLGPCSASNSAVTWTSLNNNYGVTQFYHGLPYPDGTRYLGGTQGNGTLRGTDQDGINGWQEVLGGEGGFVGIDPTNPNTIYAENTGFSLRKSTDGGATFSSAIFGITNSSLFIPPFVIDPSDPQRMWIGGNLIFRTTDGAAHWNFAGFPFGFVSAIAVAPTDSNYVLVGTELGYINRTNVGLTPVDSWPNIQPRTGYVSWVAFDPSNKNIAYATYSTFGGAHIWRSVDAGATWTPIAGSGTTGLPDIPVHCLVVDPSNTARLYVGTDLGVFVSLDSGVTWAVENTGFANVIVESLALNTVGGVTSLYAFTHGRGAWRVTVNNNSCNYALSSTGQAFGVEGGTGSVEVIASPQSCAWTASSNAPWITTSSSGSSNGRATYSVATNPNYEARVATLTIAGRSFTVTQPGLPDTTPPVVTITSPASTGTFITTRGVLTNLNGTMSDNAGRPNEPAVSSDRTILPYSRTQTTANTWKVDFPIPLASGVNKITITSRDGAGNVGSATLTVIYTPEYMIETVAGGGTNDPGDGGPALAAKLAPQSMVTDAAGNLYFAEGSPLTTTGISRIRKVSLDGTITTIAGTGPRGFNGDGIPATAAQLNGASVGGFDAAGNLYLADNLNNRIRKIDKNGIISTVASIGALFITVDPAGNIYAGADYRIKKIDAVTGEVTNFAGKGLGFSGDGGPATEAQFGPWAVALDQAGNLYILDNYSQRVRKVDKNGIITTVAGNGSGVPSGDGGPAVQAGLGQIYSLAFGQIGSLAIDSVGNIFILEQYDGMLRKISTDGIITTIAGTGANAGFSCSAIITDGMPATSVCIDPIASTVDSAGRIYIANSNGRIYRITRLGTDTVAPSVAITTPTSSPSYTTTIANGLLNLSGTAADNVRVTQVRWSNDRGGSGVANGTTNWNVTDIKLQTGVNNLTVTAWDITGNASQARLTVTYNPSNILTTLAGNRTFGSSGDGGSSLAAQFWSPRAVAVDIAGNLYVADTQNHRVRKVTRGGVVSAFAGSGQLGSSGDGGPATAASMNEPRGIAVDAAGNVYISDSQNHRIRKVTPTGHISTLAGTGNSGYSGDGGPATAAKLNFPIGIALDAAGNVYFADASNHRIRKVTVSTGIISTLAGTGVPNFSGDGGQAIAARLSSPAGVAVDSAGNILIVDQGNQRVRKVATDGTISTVAGTGGRGFNGDGIAATSAQLNEPRLLTVDALGNIYIADQGNHRIRKVSLDGTISTVAGTGTPGTGGESGAATLAQLTVPTGVALDSAGNLYIADGGNHRVVVVTLYAPNTSTNGASYDTSAVASETIVSVFGAALGTKLELATTLPLPTMLAGTTIKVRDSLGIERLAPLFYVSPTQANYLIPPGTAEGFATVIVTNSHGQISTGAVLIAPVMPGLFTANSNGQGVPAATVVRVKPDGTQLFEAVAVFDTTQSKYLTRPIDLGPENEIVVLELFGTGIRHRSVLSNVTITIGGVQAQVDYAGLQPDFVGLDQINVRVPRSLIGRGEVDLVLTVDGKAANTVKVNIK